MFKSTTLIIAFMAIALEIFLSSQASAGDSYYLLIFGSQSSPKKLKYSHTWATLVHAYGEGADPSAYGLEQATISWVPRTLDVKVFTLKPEPGINLNLYETIHAMRADSENITMWGPFVIVPEMYQRALRQIARLESGAVQYRAISGSRNLNVSDCIHAIADIDPNFGRDHYPLIRVGKPASRQIAKNLMSRSFFNQRAHHNNWLLPRLGLDRYPIKLISPQETPYLFLRPSRVNP